MNENMKPEDLQKRLESIKAPHVEMHTHRDQLRRALLQSHEQYSRSHSFTFSSMMKVIAPLAGVAAVVAIAVTGFVLTRDANTNANTIATGNTNAVTNTNSSNSIADVFGVPGAQAAPFAVYKEVPVNIHPNVTPYTVDANLKNVEIAEDIYLANETTQTIAKNLFAVSQPRWNEFFSLYENNRYENIPNFITTDSILHNYHMFFDDTLKSLEEGALREQLESLNQESVAAAQEQYAQLQGTEWGNAAKRNLIFFSVASKLLDPTVVVQRDVLETVDAEIALINEHRDVAPSPMMKVSGEPLDEDYSQYTPRGHYTKSEALKQYFRTMMWYGRLTFRFSSEDEIRSAVLQEQMLTDDTVHDPWAVIYDTTTFFVGESDDVNFPAFKKVVDGVYGTDATLDAVVGGDKWSALVAAAKAMPAPQINSMVVEEGSEDREDEILGFRFMGQRFTLDASIFQQLICRSVGNKHGTADCGGSIADSRMLPKGLDIPAAMGSDVALEELEKQGETQYFNYTNNMNTIRTMVSKLEPNTWTQNIYWTWLYALQPLTTAHNNDGYPSFMQNSAWALRDLNTYLGSWTELKHDTVLYAKQVYAELGGGHPDEVKVRGYVEPQPSVYARLAALMGMTSEGLELRGLLSPSLKANLGKMETLTLSLKTIAEKELNGEAVTDDEYELIRSYGGQLEHFWLEVNQEEMDASGLDQDNYLNQNPAAIVTDVATDPNGSVLQEGTGLISEIFVVVPVDGKLVLAKGGDFSYYEFTQPLSDRLTDEAWREMLWSDDAPTLPTWTSAFTVNQ